jgi:hypothetical protein
MRNPGLHWLPGGAQLQPDPMPALWIRDAARGETDRVGEEDNEKEGS